MDNRQLLWLFIVGGLLVGCGSDENAGGPTGTGGTGAVGSELCAKACAVPPTCDAKADVTACEAQCKKELDGTGYLDPVVAKEYFELFVARGSDPDCTYSKGDLAWWHWTKDRDRIDALPDQARMTECRDVWYSCIGPTGTQDGFRDTCFREYYRYNDGIRSQLKQCFALPCSMTEPFDCVSAAQPKGEPWLAGIDKPAFQ